MEGEEAEVVERHSQELASLTSVAASQVVSPFGALSLSSKEETGLRTWHTYNSQVQILALAFR